VFAICVSQAELAGLKKGKELCTLKPTTFVRFLPCCKQAFGRKLILYLPTVIQNIFCIRKGLFPQSIQVDE
jgi:hypothetical protein